VRYGSSRNAFASGTFVARIPAASHSIVFPVRTGRLVKLERPEGGIHRVAGDVAEGAGAVVPPSPPPERVVGRVVRTLLGRPKKQVKVEAWRHVVRVGRPVDGL
jgi:hypothetical protein